VAERQTATVRRTDPRTQGGWPRLPGRIPAGANRDAQGGDGDRSQTETEGLVGCPAAGRLVRWPIGAAPLARGIRWSRLKQLQAKQKPAGGETNRGGGSQVRGR